MILYGVFWGCLFYKIYRYDIIACHTFMVLGNVETFSAVVSEQVGSDLRPLLALVCFYMTQMHTLKPQECVQLCVCCLTTQVQAQLFCGTGARTSTPCYCCLKIHTAVPPGSMPAAVFMA